MDFFLFLLVNFTLFVRPAELVPDLGALPIYNCLILAALATSSSRILDLLRLERLEKDPITVCVLGVLFGIFMSHMIRLDTIPARELTIEFLKVVLYYLLMLAVVNSMGRLQTFIKTIAIFAAINCGVAILHFYGIIEVPSLSILKYSEGVDPETGAPLMFQRMQGTGIFSDPNDLSMIAVMGVIISLAGLTDPQSGLTRVLWLLPVGILLATCVLTKSRGGTLALGAALGALAYLRYGRIAAIIGLGLFLPLAVVATSGRGDAMAGGTGRARVELWSAGLQVVKQHPLFGVGSGRCAETIGQETHNSFLHAIVDLGLVGGAFFIGAYWFALATLWKLRQPIKQVFGGPKNGAISHLHPFILALMCGACMSMNSLSRCYIVPTYMLLGIADTYSHEVKRWGLSSVMPLNLGRIVEAYAVSAGYIVITYFYIRLTAR